MAAQDATLKDSIITYEELADLERDFEDAELEIIKKQFELSQPLYQKRSKATSKIPNFWPLVFEQAAPDIDEYIQLEDSAILASALVFFSVSRFELENGGNGDPRSVSVMFEFGPNPWFEDRVIEKKFWYRRSASGWAGLVSEPVDIEWKKGKDPTRGMLKLAKRVWDEEQAANGGDVKKDKKDKKNLTATQKLLQEKLEDAGIGATSFFAWFGFTGRNISAEESRIAGEKESKIRALRAAGEEVPAELRGFYEEAEDDDDGELEVDIFPDGDILALAITDDLWPGAVKYFIQAQEQEVPSDAEFTSQVSDNEDPEDSPNGRPHKKQKT